MDKRKNRLTGFQSITAAELLAFAAAILLIVVSIAGAGSFRTDAAYDVQNQYGETVRIFGSGVYAHDSYFKAPIFIGSDCTMLFLVVPMLLFALFREIKSRTVFSKMRLIAVLGIVLYYSASLCFGVTYNALQLLYIALFSCTLFALAAYVRHTDLRQVRQNCAWKLPTKGISVFLIFSGLALLAAWLPDILSSLLAGKPLAMIEVYTTEITYVLDMGVVSPLMFLCLALLKKKDGLGDVLLLILLRLCEVVGVMLPVQSVFQLLAGIKIPVPALLGKIGSFVVLAAFAFYFDRKYCRSLLVQAESSRRISG